MKVVWAHLSIPVLYVLFFYFSYIHFLLTSYSHSRWEKMAEDHVRLAGLIRFILRHGHRLHLASLLGRYLLLVGFSYAVISLSLPCINHPSYHWEKDNWDYRIARNPGDWDQ